MRIKVLLFAGLREKAGQGELKLEVQAGTKANDLPARIFGAEMVRPPHSLRYAVNQDYAPADKLLQEGDEVALIPPVAGG